MATYSCFWRVPRSKILLQASLRRTSDLLTLVSSYHVFPVLSIVRRNIFSKKAKIAENKSCKRKLSQDFIREDFKSTFRELAEGFSYVTSREQRAKELIEETTTLKAPRVADPAFLLSAEEWGALAKDPPEKGEDYVFVYQVQSDVLVIRFAEELARKYQCKIIYCPFPLKKQIHCRRHPYLSPEQWLGYVKHARFVVTDAFHGTVFSIIFNRNFFSEISEYGKDTGSRITNILEVFSLEKRLLTDANARNLIDAPFIEYAPINEKILKERSEAEQHIRNMLGAPETSKA